MIQDDRALLQSYKYVSAIVIRLLVMSPHPAPLPHFLRQVKSCSLAC